MKKFIDTLTAEERQSLHGTHKTPSVKRWFERHPESHLDFTPTSGSWLDQVECFFAEITKKAIRRRVFRSVAALEKASRARLVGEFLTQDSKPCSR